MEGEKKKKKKIRIKDIGIDKLVLIIAAGVVLIICSIPSGGKENKDNTTSNIKTNTQQNVTDMTYELQLESKLEEILTNIEGVGNVRVMITLKSTSEKVIKEDSQFSRSDTNEEDGQGGNRQISNITSQDDSIFTTDEAGNNVPYVIKEITPQIEGVAVIAQGGDNAGVAASITNTIEALFGVSTYKISVSKMKEGK